MVRSLLPVLFTKSPTQHVNIFSINHSCHNYSVFISFISQGSCHYIYCISCYLIYYWTEMHIPKWCMHDSIPCHPSSSNPHQSISSCSDDATPVSLQNLTTTNWYTFAQANGGNGWVTRSMTWYDNDHKCIMLLNIYLVKPCCITRHS
jgi:hypothetical protein